MFYYTPDRRNFVWEEPVLYSMYVLSITIAIAFVLG